MKNEELLPEILALLGSTSGWLHLRDIVREIGLNQSNQNDSRRVRDTISNAGGAVISNSYDGYKLTSRAKSDEYDHAQKDLQSRIDDLQRRKMETEAAWLAGQRPPPQPQPASASALWEVATPTDPKHLFDP